MGRIGEVKWVKKARWVLRRTKRKMRAVVVDGRDAVDVDDADADADAGLWLLWWSWVCRKGC